MSAVAEGEGHVVLTLTNLQSARHLGYADGKAGSARDPLTHHIRTRQARAEYYSGYIRGQHGWPLYPFCAICHDHHPVNEHTRATERPGRSA